MLRNDVQPNPLIYELLSSMTLFVLLMAAYSCWLQIKGLLQKGVNGKNGLRQKIIDSRNSWHCTKFFPQITDTRSMQTSLVCKLVHTALGLC